MKKIALIFVFMLFGFATYAQEGMKFGIQGGLPFNDFNDDVGVVAGADFGYSWALNEVIDLGIMTGYIYGFPEKFKTGNALLDLPSIQFAPLSASLRIWPTKSFSFGGNVGQAFGLNGAKEGGFYYRPQLGYLMSACTEVNLSYTAIGLDNKTWATVTLGMLYTLEFK